MGVFKKSTAKANYMISIDPHEQHVQIIVDSMELINKTLNPITYFSRYKLASNEACKISHYPHPIYQGMTAEQIYRLLNDEKDRLHKEFIDRLFAAGREDDFIYNIHEYAHGMSQAMRNYYIQKLNGKPFHFCRVRFDTDGKKYTYITRSQLQIGDTVTIPTGNKFVPESTVLQVVDTFESSLEALPFGIEKLRCVERKLRSITCPHCGAALQVNTEQKLGRCTYCQAEIYFL